MENTTLIEKAVSPPPKWYRIFNKIYGNIETFAMALILILGYTDQSTLLLIIKLSSSFLRSLVDSIMIETTTP